MKKALILFLFSFSTLLSTPREHSENLALWLIQSCDFTTFAETQWDGCKNSYEKVIYGIEHPELYPAEKAEQITMKVFSNLLAVSYLDLDAFEGLEENEIPPSLLHSRNHTANTYMKFLQDIPMKDWPYYIGSFLYHHFFQRENLPLAPFTTALRSPKKSHKDFWESHPTFSEWVENRYRNTSSFFTLRETAQDNPGFWVENAKIYCATGDDGTSPLHLDDPALSLYILVLPTYTIGEEMFTGFPLATLYTPTEDLSFIRKALEGIKLEEERTLFFHPDASLDVQLLCPDSLCSLTLLIDSAIVLNEFAPSNSE